jgi:aquaporin Z
LIQYEPQKYSIEGTMGTNKEREVTQNVVGKKSGSRGDWHVLACFRRVWQCGSRAAFPNLGIGLLGVALAFGLTVLTMAYAIGHISGCHLNPAVSVGLTMAKRFPGSELLAYVAAQLAGGIVASGVLYIIASW